MLKSCHAIGDGDRCQSTATIERIHSDVRHTLGNGDGGQTVAATVFASHFISTTCMLNGRKVIT